MSWKESLDDSKLERALASFAGTFTYHISYRRNVSFGPFKFASADYAGGGGTYHVQAQTSMN
jgi:hypothetical protein